MIRYRDRRGYAMALMMVVLMVLTTLTTVVLTSASGELSAARRSAARASGRSYAALTFEEIYARISTRPGFLTAVFDGDPRTFPDHPAVGSDASGAANWARLDDLSLPCGAQNFDHDCYRVNLYPGEASAAPAHSVLVEVLIRQRCGGVEVRCVFQRYQQRLRQQQFFDYLDFHQFSTLDPSQYPASAPLMTQTWAATNCADRYAIRNNSSLAPRNAACTSIAFHGQSSTDRDVVTGPVYTADDHIAVCGNPRFVGPVSIAGAGFTSGSDTTIWRQVSTVCSGTPETSETFRNSAVLAVPSSATTFDQARAVATRQITPASPATPATLVFSTVTSPTGQVTQVAVTGSTADGTYPVASPGVVVVSGSANVRGTVAGRFSVFARDDLTVNGDLVYSSGAGVGNTTDVIGLTAGGSIGVAKSSTNRTIHAIMLSLSGSVRTNGWRTPDVTAETITSWTAPTLTFYGAMASKYQGVFGGFDVNTGRLVSGYRKSFTFDTRPSRDPLLTPPFLISPLAASWDRLDLVELAYRG
jgi:hypothetical protein